MRNVRSRHLCDLVLLVAASCFAPAAQAGWLDWKTSSPGEKIQFSTPDSSDASAVSNATQNITPAPNPLNPGGWGQVKMDLFRPLENSMKSMGSTEGVMQLPQPQAPQPVSKRTRESIDSKRNWAFTDLNGLNSDPRAEQALGVKDYSTDGKDKQPASVVDKYYEKLGQKPGQTRDRWTGALDPAGSRGFSGSNAWSATMPALQNGDQFQKGMFSTGQDSTGFSHDASEFKAASLPDLNSPEMQAAKKYREDFDRILSPNLPPANSSDNAAPGLVDVNHQNSALTPKPAFGTQAEPHRSVVNPMLGVVDPNAAALHNHVYDDPTAASLGLPNPVAAKVPVRPPTAQSVQQMLDPFSASVVKPRF